MKLSATVFLLTGLGFSGLVLFSRRVMPRGSFTENTDTGTLFHSLFHSIIFSLGPLPKPLWRKTIQEFILLRQH